MENKFAVGDILCASYQYDRKINYFYKVAKVCPKSLVLNPVGKKLVRGDMQNGYEVAEVNNVDTSCEVRARLTKRGYYAIGSRYKLAVRKWNGEELDFYSD